MSMAEGGPPPGSSGWLMAWSLSCSKRSQKVLAKATGYTLGWRRLIDMLNPILVPKIKKSIHAVQWSNTISRMFYQIHMYLHGTRVWNGKMNQWSLATLYLSVDQFLCSRLYHPDSDISHKSWLWGDGHVPFWVFHGQAFWWWPNLHKQNGAWLKELRNAASTISPRGPGPRNGKEISFQSVRFDKNKMDQNQESIDSQFFFSHAHSLKLQRFNVCINMHFSYRLLYKLQKNTHDFDGEITISLN